MVPIRMTGTAILLAGTLLVGCSESPSSVAEKYYDDVATGDIDAAKKLATPATATMIDRVVETQGREALTAIGGRKASAETVKGNTAVVSFANEDGSTATVPMTKVDGAWKVDFAKAIKATV
ncbi:MAG: hypothetical protein WBG86_05725, partial [Polyangiales bacterium]